MGDVRQHVPLSAVADLALRLIEKKRREYDAAMVPGGSGVCPDGLFDFEDVAVHDPYLSECGRFEVDPVQHYGSAYTDWLASLAIKVTVHDLVVTEREIEIPRVCPDCGADFDAKPLTVWEYQDQYRNVRIDAPDDIQWGVPHGGENFMHISWTCGCGHVLAESTETRT